MNSIDFEAQRLAGRAVVKMDGADAARFLQGVVSADVEALGDGEASYAALLSPQGKILSDFFVFRQGHGFLIDCATSQKAELVKRPGFYKLRAQVGLGDVPDAVVGVSPEEPEAELRYRDPRLAAMGWRFIAHDGLKPSASYDAARIAAGLADTDADLGSGEFFPHEANLDQLGGVSFSKGCYIGQEVVSRMEHRGTARSRILPVQLSANAPPKGSAIRSGDKQIGTLLSSAGTRALALIRLDRLAEADAPLLTEGVSVSVLKPSFARYDVPNAKAAA